MIKNLLRVVISVLVFSPLLAQTTSYNEECTIGVASGAATEDGRPLLWKTRDYISRPDNEVTYNTTMEYAFVAVVNARGTQPWMGLNDQGFAIINSTSSDLPGGSGSISNGELMKIALGNCASVAEFEKFLLKTNDDDRSTQANFGVIDASGAAAIFETGGDVYWKFDANDSTVAPDGIVLRTNFAFNGAAKNGLNNSIYSIERYRRQDILINDFHDGDSLNYRSILRYQMRDFAYSNGDPVPVPFSDQWQSNRPYGYIFAYRCICRSTSISAAVIQGVLPDESPLLSTMWTILGQPATAVAVPYWPVGDTPAEADGPSTAPLCNIANQFRALLFDYSPNTNYIDSYKLRDGNGGGLWSMTFPAEDSIFSVAERNLAQWRSDTLNRADMLETESTLAQFALSSLTNAYQAITTVVAENAPENTPDGFSLTQNYPNPFNPETSIRFSLPEPCDVTLDIFNLLGEKVTTVLAQHHEQGVHQVQWNAAGFASGIYVYQIHARSLADQKEYVARNKLTILK